MMSWICPECGRECSPRYTGCVVCSPEEVWAAQVAEAFEVLCLEELAPPPVAGLLAGPPPSALAWAGSASVSPQPCTFPLAGSLAIPRLALSTIGRFGVARAAARAVPNPVVAAESRPRRTGSQGWIVTFAFATLIFLALGSYLQRSSSADSGTQPDPPVPVEARTATAADLAKLQPVAEDEHPYARFLEVTGLRVVGDSENRAQVQYLVVNHSGMELTGIGLKLKVRSAAGGDGADPLFSVAARVPRLGPHESKEIRMDLDTRIKAMQIPEWENLKTEARIIAQQ